MLSLLHANKSRKALPSGGVFEGVATNRTQDCRFHTVEGSEEYSSLRTIAQPHCPRGQEIRVMVHGLTLD